ncbi:MAG: hypothetical protein HQL54_07100 [Magnetococcales bacterium]|nr:hypothetical protein [Magnetococcales bacterium]
MTQVKTLSAPEMAEPDLTKLSQSERRAMLDAGLEVLECYRVMQKGGLNVVGEVLKDQGQFIELEHYPKDDVHDPDTHGQYYYHTHRETDEHGHFHLFVRSGAFPDGMTPLEYPLASAPWPKGDDTIAHIVALSMDAWGYPIGLFTTNRWVTDETWHSAESVIQLIDRFTIDHAFPNWAVNRWLTAMVQLYRHHIIALLRHRDQCIKTWQQRYPERDIFEMREFDITGTIEISVDTLITRLQKLEKQ